VNLSPDQQRVLLNEALSIYVAAGAQSVTDENRDEFAKSAEKFQLLVDSGLQNDRVYFNLATARLRAGQLGQAIANYRRALRLDPTNQLYRENLALAERRVADLQSLPALTPTAANDVLLRFVSLHAIKGLCISAWTAFWGIIALRVLRFEFHWKSAAFLTLCCFGLTAASYFVRIAEFVRDDTAVLVIPELSVREGDGTEFAEITALSDAEGRLVKVLDQRGDWMRISLDSGTTGWIPLESSERI
jgi:tetratricopeptide (TPR) repeat protein